MDRDAISGWGAVVHIIEKDKVMKYLSTRKHSIYSRRISD